MLSHAIRRTLGGSVNMSLSFFISTQNSDDTIRIPSTAVAGDIAVLYDLAKSDAWNPTVVTPTNWTSISNKAASLQFYTYNCSYKVLESNEIGTLITGMSANVYMVKLMNIFRPSTNITTIAIDDISNVGSSSQPAAQVIAAKSEYPYIIIGGAGGTTYSPSWTSVWYDQQISTTPARFAYKLFNSAGASTSIQCSDSGIYTYLNSCALTVS